MKECKKCGYIGTEFGKNRHVCNACRRTQRDMSAVKAREKTPERKEQKRKAMATYRAKHKEYYCALASEHRAKRALRSVSWSDQDYIKDLFDNAKEAGQLFNIQFEVDHIIPLQNKKVCGLHTEFNLQILTREENRAKSNKFEV